MHAYACAALHACGIQLPSRTRQQLILPHTCCPGSAGWRSPSTLLFRGKRGPGATQAAPAVLPTGRRGRSARRPARPALCLPAACCPLLPGPCSAEGRVGHKMPCTCLRPRVGQRRLCIRSCSCGRVVTAGHLRHRRRRAQAARRVGRVAAAFAIGALPSFTLQGQAIAAPARSKRQLPAQCRIVQLPAASTHQGLPQPTKLLMRLLVQAAAATAHLAPSAAASRPASCPASRDNAPIALRSSTASCKLDSKRLSRGRMATARCALPPPPPWQALPGCWRSAPFQSSTP